MLEIFVEHTSLLLKSWGHPPPLRKEKKENCPQVPEDDKINTDDNH